MSVEFEGLDELFAAATEADREIVDGCGTSVDRAAASGKAAGRVHAPRRSYALRDSIEKGSVERTQTGAASEVRADAPHAAYVVDGTDQHFIEPRRKRVLRFEQDGAIRFARRVLHPGTKPNPEFLDQAERAADEKLGASMETVVDGALQRLSG